MRGFVGSRTILTLLACVLAIGAAIPLMLTFHTSHAQQPPTFTARGGLDCNGYSKLQKLVKKGLMCKDFVGYDGGRGYDNGHYVGHDEPTVNFFSNTPGSGHNVQWEITLPVEHPLPATQSFENFITTWVGMVLCDPNSFPQKPCKPDSDQNHAPRFSGDPNTSGSSFLELQMYPPGFSPWINQISCDKVHWCAALNIDSLECGPDINSCNQDCIEPVNFAFLQTDGVPTGPPGPASQTDATFTPNKHTLLMNQGDHIVITTKDTDHGLLTRIDDTSTGKSGFMVASAKNGFQSLNRNTCAPTNFDYHPEYSTAKYGNFLNWGLGAGNIGLDVEIGHFQPGPNGDGDADDAPCFPGPTVAGCIGEDDDFDGTSYLSDWPDGTRLTPTPIKLGSVLGNGVGPVSADPGTQNYKHVYTTLQFDTEVLATETTTCTEATLSGCTVPPPGAVFYPFFAQSGQGASCIFTFGNDIRGATVNDFGRDLEYGVPNQAWTFLDAQGGIRPNPCTPKP